MPQDQGTVRTVHWGEVAPWLVLFRSFRFARELPKLALAAIALLATSAGWSAIDAVFSGSSDPSVQATRAAGGYSRPPWRTHTAGSAPGLGPVLNRAGRELGLERAIGPAGTAWLANDPVLGTWHTLSRPFGQLFDLRQSWLAFLLSLLCALWAAAVWGLFGGAIARIAAVEFAQDKRLGWKNAFGFAFAKWRDLFGAPLFPLAGVLILVALVSLVAWLLRWNGGVIVLALGWPAMLVAGFLLAVLALGLALGWPLMFPTIGAERGDTFDALSRSYGFVLHRPFHYAFYGIVATALGIVGWLVVATVAGGAVYLSAWSASWTAGGARTAAVMRSVPADVRMFDWSAADADDRTPRSRSTTAKIGGGILAVSLGGVKLLAIAFGYSFFFTSSTAIYLLLRLEVDGKEMDEVYLDDQEQLYGLPPLTTDEAGVPVVDPNEAPIDPPSAGAAERAGERVGGQS